jgi:hypothetical protein
LPRKLTLFSHREATTILTQGVIIGDKTVKVIDSEPALTSDIIAVTKGKPSAKVQTLYSFLATDGKRYVIK